jgi:hypothetical protein
MTPGRLFVALIGFIASLTALLGVLIVEDPPTSVSALAPGEAVSQMAALRAKVGGPLKAVSVTLGPDGTSVEVQNQGRPQVSDEWTVAHLHGLAGLVDWTYVSGPEPVSSGQAIAPMADRVFDLAPIDFAIVPNLTRAATERVALEEPGAATTIELSKPQILIPAAHAGTLRWLVSVKAAHESATATADPTGHVTGVDLAQTLRAQRLDLFADSKTLLDLVQVIDKQFDGKASIDHLLLYDKRFSFHLASGQPAPGQDNYTCDLDGVRHDGLTDSSGIKPMTMPGFVPQDQPFGIRDANWAALPHLLQRAREILGLPQGQPTLLRLAKRSTGLDPATLQWEIDLRDPSNAKGSVTLDSAGNPLKSPRSDQAKPASMLEPAAISGFVEALRRKLDPHTAIMEITVTPREGHTDLRDPQDPTNIISLGYDGVALALRPSLSDKPGRYMGMPYDADWLFELGAVDASILQDLPAWEAAALQRLNIPGGKVTGITFGRQRLMFPANRQLTVKIDVTGDRNTDGRVYFDPHGNVMRADGP